MNSRRRRVFALAAELSKDPSERLAYEGFCARLGAESRRRCPAETVRLRRKLERTCEGRGLDWRRLGRCTRAEAGDGRRAQG